MLLTARSLLPPPIAFAVRSRSGAGEPSSQNAQHLLQLIPPPSSAEVSRYFI
jgi:hypothetical protein